MAVRSGDDRQVCRWLQRLALARRAIIGIYFPPIPWPMTLTDHLEKLREVLRRLWGAGLKVNAAKLCFCTHKIEYRGYILTREGIKSQPKKLQAILALNPPHNVRELRHFLSMVQYYRNMLVKRSEMLAPFSDLRRVRRNENHQAKQGKKRNLGTGIQFIK